MMMVSKLPTTDDLNDLMDSEQKKERNELDVLTELFKKKDVETKTELTNEQIILINQKRTIAKIIGFKALDDALDDFMLLMISKDRQGRAEFVDGFKSNREKEMSQEGFFQNMKNRFSNK